MKTLKASHYRPFRCLLHGALRYALCAMLLLLLSSCGGGGSGASDPGPYGRIMVLYSFYPSNISSFQDNVPRTGSIVKDQFFEVPMEPDNTFTLKFDYWGYDSVKDVLCHMLGTVPMHAVRGKDAEYRVSILPVSASVCGPDGCQSLYNYGTVVGLR